MITDYNKARFVDENKTGEFFAEVNWNKYDEKVKDCKLVRFTFPGGKAIVVQKDALISFIFAIGSEEEQRKLIKEFTTRSRWYETTVSVTAKQDIKKGEELTFPIKLTLPTFSEEIVAEAKRDLTKNSSGVDN